MVIHIVEPTLVSDAGHCAAIFGSLHRAAPDLPYRLWVDRHADAPSVAATGVPMVRYFNRTLRRLQAAWLYWKLLRSGDLVYIPTATWVDLRLVDLAAPGTLPPGRAVLYFHKWRPSAARNAALARLAQRQPNLHLLAAARPIADRLRAAGFKHVDEVIPINAEPGTAPPQATFRYVLYAGAAREDKGFADVVALVAELARQGDRLPVLVQTTGDHYGRYDAPTQAALERLRSIDYPALQMLDSTPDRLAYAQLFPGSICLQPYKVSEYADKTSSVTYDALMAGAPIVTLAGTPMARLVEETGAGLVVNSSSASALRAAVLQIHADYTKYAQLAAEAGKRFDPVNAWAPFVNVVKARGDR
jgi:glycosyltransferase involved in cell wall biosynthesis